MSSYSSKLRDARWQRKRLEVMERDAWACRSCGDGEVGVTLNVHHSYYDKGKSPWDYPDDSLVTLCSECHERITRAVKSAAKSLSFISADNAERMAALCDGARVLYGDCKIKMRDFGSATVPEMDGVLS